MGRIRIDLQWEGESSLRALGAAVRRIIRLAARGGRDGRYLSGVGHPAVSIAPSSPPRPQGGDAVAGRIERASNSLNAAMEAWLAWLQDRNKRPKSIEAFRRTIEFATRETGWNDVSHLTYDAIMAYLGQQRRERGWKPATYNATTTPAAKNRPRH